MSPEVRSGRNLSNQNLLCQRAVGPILEVSVERQSERTIRLKFQAFSAELPDFVKII
jgi:hypothetical protein